MSWSCLTVVRADARKREWFARNGVAVHAVSRTPLNKALELSVIPLDRSQWAELRHAYGPASDIPSLLRAIAADPAASHATAGPWYELWSALYHQGDIYPASFAAVPHVIQALAADPHTACCNFFLFPASVEVARARDKVHVPEHIADAYFASLQRIPSIAYAASARSWDASLCRSILAAVAVAKSQHATAELMLEIDDGDTSEVLEWYFSR